MQIAYKQLRTLTHLVNRNPLEKRYNATMDCSALLISQLPTVLRG